MGGGLLVPFLCLEVVVLSVEQRQLMFRLRAMGRSCREIGVEVGVSHVTVVRTLRGDQVGGGRVEEPWMARSGCLQALDRELIVVGLGRGETFSAIAVRIGCSVSTVSREVRANGGRDGYQAWRAQYRARRQACRPKPAKLDYKPLCDQVTLWLQQLWSPEEISGRLRVDFEHDPVMRVSHETIYQSLFVQGRGELRRELHRCLRSGRAERKQRGTPKPGSGRLGDRVSISERPAEADDRAVPGHWEGDMVMGTGNKSAVGTLVERTTRFVILLHLPDGKDAVSVAEAMRKAITELPAILTRSITWDQGIEMSRHADFTIATGIPVYFCDPHSPWQRGTNENTNGLLRQYLPKGTDLSIHTAEQLATIAHSLNTRPRKTLRYMTPSEALNQHLALTA